VRHGIGEQRRQIIAGSPSQGLRGAERQDDWKLALAHIPVFLVGGVIGCICCPRRARVNSVRGIFDLLRAGALVAQRSARGLSLVMNARHNGACN
jgi:hypothetical protein